MLAIGHIAFGDWRLQYRALPHAHQVHNTSRSVMLLKHLLTIQLLVSRT